MYMYKLRTWIKYFCDENFSHALIHFHLTIFYVQYIYIWSSWLISQTIWSHYFFKELLALLHIQYRWFLYNLNFFFFGGLGLEILWALQSPFINETPQLYAQSLHICATGFVWYLSIHPPALQVSNPSFSAGGKVISDICPLCVVF